MEILEIIETSYEDMYKVKALGDNNVLNFFIRKAYLTTIDFDSLYSGGFFIEQQQEELLDAGLTCAVELKALDYLARAEQSRFGLTRKLSQKGYEKKYIDRALDYLENKNYVNDARFAEAWLNSRKLNHFEGKTKLISELQNRGISKDVTADAVNSFFKENDEMEICCKAYEKFVKKGKTDEKLIAALLNAGFSYKLIKQAKIILLPQDK